MPTSVVETTPVPADFHRTNKDAPVDEGSWSKDDAHIGFNPFKTKEEFESWIGSPAHVAGEVAGEKTAASMAEIMGTSDRQAPRDAPKNTPRVPRGRGFNQPLTGGSRAPNAPSSGPGPFQQPKAQPVQSSVPSADELKRAEANAKLDDIFAASPPKALWGTSKSTSSIPYGHQGKPAPASYHNLSHQHGQKAGCNNPMTVVEPTPEEKQARKNRMEYYCQDAHQHEFHRLPPSALDPDEWHEINREINRLEDERFRSHIVDKEEKRKEANEIKERIRRFQEEQRLKKEKTAGEKEKAAAAKEKKGGPRLPSLVDYCDSD